MDQKHNGSFDGSEEEEQNISRKAWVGHALHTSLSGTEAVEFTCVVNGRNCWHQTELGWNS